MTLDLDEIDPHWHCAACDDHNAAEEIDGALVCAFCGAAWVLCDPDTCPEIVTFP